MIPKFLLVYTCLLSSVIKGVSALSCDQVAAKLSKHDFPLTCPSAHPLGEGASGVAYVVQGPRNQLLVGKAVLFETNKHRERFRNELLFLSVVKGHPNVINMFTYASDNDYGYLLLEFGEEGTLEDFIETYPDMGENPRLVLKIFQLLLKGVNHIHQKKLVHADLKPANIVMGRGSVPKVIDFDLATDIGDHGFTRGTPFYIDPAHLLDEHAVYTPSTDIHALGVILYEMSHGGEKPYPATEMKQLLRKIIKGEYIIGKRVHWLIAFLIAKCLTLDRSHRMEISAMIDLIDAEMPYVNQKLMDNDLFPGSRMDGIPNYELDDFKPKQIELAIHQNFIDADGTEWDDNAIADILKESSEKVQWQPAVRTVQRTRRDTNVAHNLAENPETWKILNKHRANARQGNIGNTGDNPVNTKKTIIGTARIAPQRDNNTVNPEKKWTVGIKKFRSLRRLSKASGGLGSLGDWWAGADPHQKVVAPILAIALLCLLVAAVLKVTVAGIRSIGGSSKTELSGQNPLHPAAIVQNEPFPVTERTC